MYFRDGNYIVLFRKVYVLIDVSKDRYDIIMESTEKNTFCM